MGCLSTSLCASACLRANVEICALCLHASMCVCIHGYAYFLVRSRAIVALRLTKVQVGDGSLVSVTH